MVEGSNPFTLIKNGQTELIKTKANILLLLIIIPFFTGSNLISGYNNLKKIESSPLNIEPNYNQSSPFLNLSSKIVEIGSNFNITFGMRNDTNITQFISGYSYTILRKDKALSELILYNGITNEFATRIEINTYSPEKYIEGNFTIHLVIESTYRGTIEINQSINFITNTNAHVIFSLTKKTNLASETNFLVNRFETIELAVENIGGANAFSIEAFIQSIEPPVGLNQSEFQFPINIELLESGDIIRLLFEIKPERLGVGSLEIRTKFQNSINTTISGTIRYIVSVLPQIQVNLVVDSQITNNDQSEVIANIFNQENIGIIISEIITSNKIIFSNDPSNQKLLNRNLEIKYFGSVISFGDSFILYSVYFYDSDGTGQAIIFEQPYSISIKEGTIVSEDNNLISTILITATLSILFIISFLLFFIFLIRNSPRINRLFAKKVLKTNINSRFNYNKREIIVDGSNIAWETPKNSKTADLENLKMAHKSLKESGFKNIQIVVDASLRYRVGNVDSFDELAKNKFFKVLPAKVDADLFILRLSEKSGAFILSNDLFKEFREEFAWIDKKRIPFSILDNSFFLHPNAADKFSKS